jgi:hypothetical protein
MLNARLGSRRHILSGGRFRERVVEEDMFDLQSCIEIQGEQVP